MCWRPNVGYPGPGLPPGLSRQYLISSVWFAASQNKKPSLVIQVPYGLNPKELPNSFTASQNKNV
jgi:hypothetical protein